MILIPELAKRIPNWSGWNKFAALTDELRRIVGGNIDEHRKTFSSDEVPRDFIDVYLNEIHSTTDSSSSFYKDTGDKNLLAVIADLFGAGSETTSLTLSWAVLYLSKFREIQNKLQEELDNVVGKSRQVSLADRPK